MRMRDSITQAVLTAIKDEIQKTGNMDFEPFDKPVGFWFTVGGNSRGIRPTPEFVAAAVVEKLERDLGVGKGMIGLHLVTMQGEWVRRAR